MRDTTSAISAQWPGGNSERGPSAQYSAVTFCRSLSPLPLAPLARASRPSMFLGSKEPLASLSGPGGVNWTGELSANGFTFFHCGVVARCTEVQVVVPGGGSGTHSGCQRQGSLTVSQVLTGW